MANCKVKDILERLTVFIDIKKALEDKVICNLVLTESERKEALERVEKKINEILETEAYYD